MTLSRRLNAYACISGGAGAMLQAVLPSWWLSGLTLLLLAALCIAASLALGEEE